MHILVIMGMSYTFNFYYKKKQPKIKIPQGHESFHFQLLNTNMQSNYSKQQPDHNSNEYLYDSEQFQSPADDSYGSKVERLFAINYENSSYQNIELSTTQMRLMMKQVSKKLDEKIHKYYGLMAQKPSNIEENLEKLKQKLTKQYQTNKKLIENQATQINEIQILDKQMSSSKRIQKQAQRLRQYFETKKAMIQSDKQTRFEKGEMDKAGDYLARDLDSQKHYFRLNKIKQDLQYAMLKERTLTKRYQQLQTKHQQLHNKHQKISQAYNQKIIQAENNNLLIQENKIIFTQHQRKCQLLQLREQIKKKTEILKYNLQNTVIKISLDLQKMKKTQKQHLDKIASCEQKISTIQKSIDSDRQKTQLTRKLELSMPIRNIDTLLKNKKQKNDSMLKNLLQQSQSIQPQFKPTVQMTESSILLKPNFKIKHFLSKSKPKIDFKDQKMNKSMDFGKKISKASALNDLLQNTSNKVSNYHKKILKWKPTQKRDHSNKILPLLAPKDSHTANPQQQIYQNQQKKSIKLDECLKQND